MSVKTMRVDFCSCFVCFWTCFPAFLLSWVSASLVRSCTVRRPKVASDHLSAHGDGALQQNASTVGISEAPICDQRAADPVHGREGGSGEKRVSLLSAMVMPTPTLNRVLVALTDRDNEKTVGPAVVPADFPRSGVSAFGRRCAARNVHVQPSWCHFAVPADQCTHLKLLVASQRIWTALT